MDLLPKATEIEQKTLRRIKADPDTRLACQAIPRSGEIKVERLLPPYIEPKDLRRARAAQMVPADGVAIAGAAK
jgi:hypothetical protein